MRPATGDYVMEWVGEYGQHVLLTRWPGAKVKLCTCEPEALGLAAIDGIFRRDRRPVWRLEEDGSWTRVSAPGE